MINILHSQVFGEGKPLVILHGLFGTLDNWQSLAKLFGQFFETHIVDQRNHGKSFHADAHNYELMCEDLLYYLEDQDLDKVCLCFLIIGLVSAGRVAVHFVVEFAKCHQRFETRVALLP